MVLMIADFSELIRSNDWPPRSERKYPRLHTLVNNAGTYNGKRTLTAAGYETTFAVNHLGYFLLTDELIDLLKSSAPSRVVNVASERTGQPRQPRRSEFGEWLHRLESVCAIEAGERALHLSTCAPARGNGAQPTACIPACVGTNLFNNVKGTGGTIVRLITPLHATPEKGARHHHLAGLVARSRRHNRQIFHRPTRADSNPQSYDTKSRNVYGKSVSVWFGLHRKKGPRIEAPFQR